MCVFRLQPALWKYSSLMFFIFIFFDEIGLDLERDACD